MGSERYGRKTAQYGRQSGNDMNICLHSSAASIDFLQVHAYPWLLGRIFVVIFIKRLNINDLMLFQNGHLPAREGLKEPWTKSRTQIRLFSPLRVVKNDNFENPAVCFSSLLRHSFVREAGLFLAGSGLVRGRNYAALAVWGTSFQGECVVVYLTNSQK